MAPRSTRATRASARRRSWSPRATGTSSWRSCCSTRAPTSNAQTTPAKRRRDSYRRASRRRDSRAASASSARAGPRTGASVFRPAGAKTPLLYATREGHLEVVTALGRARRDLELADGNGVTPLINAIVNASIFRVNRTGASDHLAIASFLLDAGANVNAQDWYGETPLWTAVDLRNLELGRDGNDTRRSRGSVHADRAVAARQGEPERAHARVPARAALHRRDRRLRRVGRSHRADAVLARRRGGRPDGHAAAARARRRSEHRDRTRARRR